MWKVYNLKTAPAGWKNNPDFVYIGRPAGNTNQHFGNPFTHLSNTKATVVVGSRAEAVQAFEDWLMGDPHWAHVEPARREWIILNLHTLKNKHLVCWCAPLACHGDVLLRLANLV